MFEAQTDIYLTCTERIILRTEIFRKTQSPIKSTILSEMLRNRHRHYLHFSAHEIFLFQIQLPRF
jgi:hypothetical protein